MFVQPNADKEHIHTRTINVRHVQQGHIKSAYNIIIPLVILVQLDNIRALVHQYAVNVQWEHFQLVEHPHALLVIQAIISLYKGKDFVNNVK